MRPPIQPTFRQYGHAREARTGIVGATVGLQIGGWEYVDVRNSGAPTKVTMTTDISLLNV